MIHKGRSTGITPACAGRRLYPGGGYYDCTDHPRLRGEKNAYFDIPEVKTGSPPPARGEGFGGVLLALSHGITPACAGRSSAGLFANLFSRDHPRLRGEKPAQILLQTNSKGSPPPARGEAGYTTDTADTTGITPACAGRSLPSNRRWNIMEDHPRLRGEKIIIKQLKGYIRGSPPPARGEVTIPNMKRW